MSNDPCPSCDGDEYDEASGECSECGFNLEEFETQDLEDQLDQLLKKE